MTEADWLAETDLNRLLSFAEPRLSPRKARLLTAALCRAVGLPKHHPDFLAALDVIERHADGLATSVELDDARQRCRVLAIQQFEDSARSAGVTQGALAIIQSELAWAVAFAATTPLSVEAVGRRVLETTHPSYADVLTDACRRRLFDVAGNPFRPVSFDPAWRTRTAVALAGQMYESRDFGAMPILADALQDAGCTSEDILDHCRDAEFTHVRGCWVLDGVLENG